MTAPIVAVCLAQPNSVYSRSQVQNVFSYFEGCKIFNFSGKWFYQGVSTVLQYFVHVTHNSAASDTSAEIIKVMNHTGFWDAELAWYSPSATHWICLHGLKHGLGIHVSRSTWPCLIIFLQLKQNFLNHLLIVLWSTVSSLFALQMFLVVSVALFPSLNM